MVNLALFVSCRVFVYVTKAKLDQSNVEQGNFKGFFFGFLSPLNSYRVNILRRKFKDGF